MNKYPSLLIALTLAFTTPAVFAQIHQPLTIQEAIAPTVARTPPTTRAHANDASEAANASRQQYRWTTRSAIGPTTLSLMEAQAAGTHAGAHLPTLGAAATRSWQRYLDSFSNPLPPMFEESVESR